MFSEFQESYPIIGQCVSIFYTSYYTSYYTCLQLLLGGIISSDPQKKL